LSTDLQDQAKISKDTIKINNEKSNSKPSLHRRLKNSRVDNLNMQIVRTLNSVEPSAYYGNQSQKQNISVDFESPNSSNLYDRQHTPAKKYRNKIEKIKMDATRSMFLQSSSKNNSEIIRVANSIQSSTGNKTRIGANFGSGSGKKFGKSYESIRNKKVHIITNLKFDDVAGDLINGTNNISKTKK
jgi:hypothetical protein